MTSTQKATGRNLFKAIPSIIMIIGFAIIIFLKIIFIRPTLNELLDFGSFLASGNAIRNGNNPYASDQPRVFNPGAEQVLPSPNLNPPISVILFEPLTNHDPLEAVWGWRISTVVQFAVAIYILGKVYSSYITPLRILWAFSLTGFWTTLALGQIYASILILLSCAWVLMEKGKPIPAGIALGVVIAIKPNFVFWALLLGIARQFQIFLSSAVTAVGLSLLPIPIFGIRLYKQWLAALSEYPSIGLQIAGNSSLQSLSARFGLPSLGVVVAIIFAGAIIYLVHRNRNSMQDITSLGIVGSVLLSPFAWSGYTMLCLPIFFSRPQWKWPIAISAFILVFPYILVMYYFNASFFHSILFGWLYGWGLIILFIEILLELSRKMQSTKDYPLHDLKVNP